MKVNFLIVGCGFTGATFAERIATQLNKKVLVVEKRNHIGGNAYDCYNEHGILIHKYGPHIFRTSSPKISSYLTSFCSWRPYFHKVLALVDGSLVPVPFNLNSVNQVFPKNYAAKLEDELIDKIGFNKTITIHKLFESKSPLLQELANYIFEKVYLHYTKKQWGLNPDQLSPSVIGRVPVRVNRDDRYFDDWFQAMPTQGYTVLFEKMLNHPNIHILLNTDYKEIVKESTYDQMIYTGPIDEFFDFCHGPLPYRSLEFEYMTLEEEYVQPVAVINYPNNFEYTRVSEFKHISGQKHSKTTLAYEYPKEYVIGKNIPYYPVLNDETKERFRKYEKEAEKISQKVIFAGRLADYQYYNMAQAVGRALRLFETRIMNG
ncbi:MAG: UDP-galactopyranose mutase [bacterium]|nr:UDP-galactopyranose mutase [bacterium]